MNVTALSGCLPGNQLENSQILERPEPAGLFMRRRRPVDDGAFVVHSDEQVVPMRPPDEAPILYGTSDRQLFQVIVRGFSFNLLSCIILSTDRLRD